MSGVSREEAVALGEGVTAGPWRHPNQRIAHVIGADCVVHSVTPDDWIATPLCQPRWTADARLIAAAPRLRETVVELHDRVAELEREVTRLRDHLHVIERADGVEAETLRRWAFESSLGDRPILPPSEVRELGRAVERLRAQVADVGWAGDWFTLDDQRLRWLRVHGGTEDQTWHLIDEGAASPRASLWHDGRCWAGRRPTVRSVERSTAAAACEALYPGLTPPVGCEP